MSNDRAANLYSLFCTELPHIASYTAAANMAMERPCESPVKGTDFLFSNVGRYG